MLKFRMSVDKMLEELRKENIKTWFDLGIFIDRFKESKPLPTALFEGTYDMFLKGLSKSAMAFITFFISLWGAF